MPVGMDNVDLVAYLDGDAAVGLAERADQCCHGPPVPSPVGSPSVATLRLVHGCVEFTLLLASLVCRVSRNPHEVLPPRVRSPYMPSGKTMLHQLAS